MWLLSPANYFLKHQDSPQIAPLAANQSFSTLTCQGQSDQNHNNYLNKQGKGKGHRTDHFMCIWNYKQWQIQGYKIISNDSLNCYGITSEFLTSVHIHV